MTKEVNFDLEFLGGDHVQAVSARGENFLAVDYLYHDICDLYRRAVDAGLHTRFETAAVRDWVTAV
jgi:hypothetical protein